MPTIPVNNYQLYFESQGIGDTVIYVHGGFPSLQMTMRELKPFDWSWELDFAKHFRFVWYDRRGCYRSSGPTDDYTFENQTEDLRQLLYAFGNQSVHLIGSSAGGPIAITFAAQHPKAVKSIVLTGTALNLFPEDDTATQIIREQLRILDLSGPEVAFDQRPEGIETTFDTLWATEEARERGTLEQFLTVQQRIYERARHIPRTERVAWYVTELQSIRTYIEFDLLPYASRIQHPTMILHGSADRAVPLEWAIEMSRVIPDNELVVIDSGSHSLMIKNSAARDKVIQFFKSHSDSVIK